MIYKIFVNTGYYLSVGIIKVELLIQPLRYQNRTKYVRLFPYLQRKTTLCETYTIV